MSCRLEGQQRVINQGLWLMSLVLTLPSHPQGLGPIYPLCSQPLILLPSPFHLCLCSRLCNQEGNLLFCWNKTC